MLAVEHQRAGCLTHRFCPSDIETGRWPARRHALAPVLGRRAPIALAGQQPRRARLRAEAGVEANARDRIAESGFEAGARCMSSPLSTISSASIVGIAAQMELHIGRSASAGETAPDQFEIETRQPPVRVDRAGAQQRGQELQVDVFCRHRRSIRASAFPPLRKSPARGRNRACAWRNVRCATSTGPCAPANSMRKSSAITSMRKGKPPSVCARNAMSRPARSRGRSRRPDIWRAHSARDEPMDRDRRSTSPTRTGRPAPRERSGGIVHAALSLAATREAAGDAGVAPLELHIGRAGAARAVARGRAFGGDGHGADLFGHELLRAAP